MTQKNKISHHVEEGPCDMCGCPLYVGDICYIGEEGDIFCSRSCETEHYEYNNFYYDNRKYDDYYSY